VKLKTEQALYVLDSSAVIALVRREQGWEKVQAALDHSVISAVNLTESMTKLIRQGGQPRLVEPGPNLQEALHAVANQAAGPRLTDPAPCGRS